MTQNDEPSKELHARYIPCTAYISTQNSGREEARDGTISDIPPFLTPLGEHDLTPYTAYLVRRTSYGFLYLHLVPRCVMIHDTDSFGRAEKPVRGNARADQQQMFAIIVILKSILEL